ncbi:MAG: glycerol-3-phosphate 1-O-acyltransferase PlsY [Lachnospiraceae bacterium]
MERVVCLVIGYLCGLIQTGYLVGKMKGIDIREHGSKNAGTTNVLRTMGAKYGAVVLLGDAVKCLLAVLLCYLLFGVSCKDWIKLLQLYAGAGAVLGHNYPFYMHFKGGKGIASTAGIVISFGPLLTFLGVITFFGTFFLTHYVSLGSMLVYVGLMIEVVILGEQGFFGFPQEIARPMLNEFYIVVFLLAIMAFVRHKENIKRLLQGNERKTYLKKKPEIDLSNQAAQGLAEKGKNK